MASPKFHGLYVASLTPYKNDGSIDASAVDAYAQHLKANSINGVFANGTSGESMSLSTSERQDLLKAWSVSGKAHNLSLIANVGAQSLADSCALAEHADGLSVDAIACMAPCFFKPASVDDLVEYLRLVAASAPKTPFLFYHFPDMTGVNFRVCELFAKAKLVIPTLAGCKYTGSDLGDVQQVVTMGYDVLIGNEPMFYPALAVGATGGVGLFYSVFPKTWYDIYQAYQRGDHTEARTLQIEATRIVYKCVNAGPAFAVQKALLRELHQLDCGGMRPPLRNADQEAIAKLIQELEGKDRKSVV
eukprot:TRINITY_DN1363_c1_g1_i3.p1 TRINITY_DN1363_c1_g1~~TRINITY_DN1363_c1_g1_i3.p1  ORF type:complete len:319 (+),score=33.33 TRINITY_DN1363_c1_g1_i3:50-958(+)